MAQHIADRRDIDFVLYDQLDADNLMHHEKYGAFNKKVFDMMITEARNFAVKEILPTYAEGEKEGVQFAKNQAKVPVCFHRIKQLLVEGEWTSLTEDPALGGQGLPHLITQAVNEYLMGANSSFALYWSGAHGAGKMIELFGSQTQKDLFLEKLYTYQWSGTMLLTEPQAGSDLGEITTTAAQNSDETYSITGNKIFITSGEHDLTENIIHPVLARVEGAPKGTKGISIFIVPKIWVNADGSLGEPNDVVCTGVEEKMGIHANATCSLALGGKGKCRGLLLGKEGMGMKIMFHMMNEARLDVGFQGFSLGSVAYLYALNYARERYQGKDLDNVSDPDAPQVPIICHPDVRRMLLWMKSHVEGMRSLIYYVRLCFDKMAVTTDKNQKAHYDGLIQLLTPVVKAYCSERGFEVCNLAMQVYGGYGYIKDYPIEQLLRDCRITSIYEGTNGIQAMDLLGRKLGMNNGMVFMGFLEEVQKVVVPAKDSPELNPLAIRLEASTNRLGEVALHLGTKAMSSDRKLAFAFAHPFLEVMGDIIMAWMLLWRAEMASAKLAGQAKKKDTDFYEGQIKSAEFFIHSILPITMGKMKAILESSRATVDIADATFGG